MHVQLRATAARACHSITQQEASEYSLVGGRVTGNELSGAWRECNARRSTNLLWNDSVNNNYITLESCVEQKT